MGAFLSVCEVARLVGRHEGTIRRRQLNRDWRMIAVTETAQNHNNAFLFGREPSSFVGGQSYPDACAWCRANTHGKTLKVVEPPTDPLQRPDRCTQIWAGKSSFGRYQSPWSREGYKRGPSELRAPAAIAHPNCRCWWVSFDPEYQYVDARGSVHVK